MTSYKKKPKTIASLLEKTPFQQSTSLITELNTILQRILKSHHIPRCRIGSINGGSLLIESPSAIWLQRLQFIRSELLFEFRQHHPSIINIKVKVNPELAKVPVKEIKSKRPKKRATKMSSDVAASFLALADNADPKLRKALQSLAKFSTEEKGLE